MFQSRGSSADSASSSGYWKRCTVLRYSGLRRLQRFIDPDHHNIEERPLEKVNPGNRSARATKDNTKFDVLTVLTRGLNVRNYGY